MSIPDKDLKMLWANSGNQCAFPGCNVELAKKEKSGEKVIVGENAHIKGKKAGSPRYDVNMSDKERDSYENLILLCPTHHKTIDDASGTYTVEKLTEMKVKHEEKVKQIRKEAEIYVTFVELESITQFLASAETEIEETITVIPPKDKIKKNQLSHSIEEYIKIGMLKSKLVKEYIDRNFDVDFGERLKKGFADKYLELKQSGKSGDEIFLELFEFASNGSSDFKKQAAALAVLTYFFETCEVFEE